jgi:isocitrate dehydrogenase kinase/phosphatase
MVPVFYQSTRAFLVGKIEGEEWTAPFAIVVENIGGRVKVEAVLMSEDDMSILFGFTRSYFRATCC